jgi:hypothetical protein
MKSIFKPFYVLIALAMAHVPVVAQNEIATTIPGWVPESGYWVAENNVHKPKQYTIYFYTDEHELIYKEKIEGVVLDLDSPRVKMRLKKVLENSLQAWRKQHRPKENEGLVINLLKGK